MFAMLRDGRDVDLSQLAVARGPFARTVVRLLPAEARHRREPIGGCATTFSPTPTAGGR
jgi:hypothetical protein